MSNVVEVLFTSMHYKTAFLLAFAVGIFACQQGNAASPPNVLFIAIDDLNDWTGCLAGHPQALTPNIDRLAQRGVLFTNAHCQAPLCGPSRASLLTGLYPHATGVYQQPNKDALARDENLFRGQLLPEYFAAHGYRTMAVGKITHGYSAKIAFDDYGGSFQGFGPYPPQRERFNYFLPDVRWTGTLTDWGAFPATNDELSDHQTADWTIDQLKEEFDKPFFLGVGFVRPHVPFYVPQKWFDLFPAAKIHLPDVRSDDLEDIPATGRSVHEVPKYPQLDFLLADENAQFKKCVQAYLACVAFVDHQVGRVLHALESSPYADNTVVVLFSDHGYHLGEKDRVCKHSLWEEATRVPLCIADFRPRDRRVVAVAEKTDQPVGLIDLFPTLTELCGLPRKSTNQGKSLVPLLKSPNSARLDRQGILTTYGRGNHSIRTSRFRYIRYLDGSEELYDHQTDPNEFTNLADRPAYAEQKQSLAELLPKHDAPYHPSTKTDPINQWFEDHFRQEGLSE